MKKLLIGAALCALFAVPGFAGEPAKLTSAQMDVVTAGCDFAICTQINSTWQNATAVAVGGSSAFSAFSSNAAASASNKNKTVQVQGTD
jgi:hypothetical protein